MRRFREFGDRPIIPTHPSGVQQAIQLEVDANLQAGSQPLHGAAGGAAGSAAPACLLQPLPE